jgi:hypothetical protein
MTVISRIGQSLWRFVCLNVVALDPLRRRRVRTAAKHLVPTKAWATKDATADEIARLALLRVLFLQRETRRVARHGGAEASAMLARAAIETAISGLFCVYVPGAEGLFEGETSKRTKRLLTGFAEAKGMAEVLDQAFAQLGSGKLPSVTAMVEQIKANGGAPSIGSLHTDFYDQISTLYIHGGPLGLIRHVHPRTGATLERPYLAWSKRSAVHIADAMVGLLAAEIAGDGHPDSALFRTYAQTHFRVTWNPLAFLVRRLMVTQVDYRYLPDMIRLVLHLMAKLRLGQPLAKTDIEEVIGKLCLLTQLDPDDPSLTPFSTAIQARLNLLLNVNSDEPNARS